MFILGAKTRYILKNAGKQIALVKGVFTKPISYKKIELPDGPMYILSKNDIEKIVYKNGYTEIIKPEVIEVSIQPTVSWISLLGWV